MPRLLLLALLCLSFAVPASSAERAMVGYYATFGGMPVEEIPWGSLTHLCHAFLRVDAVGEPVTTDATPNAALTADGRKNGVPVLLSIGGGVTAQGLEKATADEASTKAFVVKVLKIVNEGRYDGVDLDWEFPRDAATGAAHARLIRLLRRGLNTYAQRSGRDTPYLLTTVVNPSPFFGQWIDIESVAPQVDWLNVAAYDFAGPWSQSAGHHSPLFGSSRDKENDGRGVVDAMRYWETERGVPKRKLLMGVPMYGWSMPARAPHDTLDPELASRHRTLPFADVRKLVGEGWRAQWENESRAPWLSKPPAEAKPAGPLTTVDPENYDGPAIISYDDRNSVHGKAVWANEQGYRGLYFWAVHQDRMPDGRHWLIEAANSAWPAE